MKEMSMEDAIIQVFNDSPNKIFTVQEIYGGIQYYYELSDYQLQINPDYPQANYKHWIRSILAKLERQGIIKKIGRNERKLVT